MADQVPSWYVEQFSTNVQLLLQQEGSRLSGAVMSGTHVGSQASPVDQIAPITANKAVERFAPMSRVDAVLTRRWAFPVDYDLPQLIDSFDMLRIITDPKSHYSQNASNALGRAKDVEIINAMFGASATGVNGASSITFPTSQQVVVAQGAASATGMSVAKLKAAKKILMQNEVNLKSDMLYCAITAKQHDELLAETQIIDSDYNNGTPVLTEGLITRFLGINFIHTELLNQALDDTSTLSTAVPIWAKSGVHIGVWNDIKTSVSVRNDIQGEPWQVYAKGTFGATRLDEKRVVEVFCR